MDKDIYSIRTGINPNKDGFNIKEIIELFIRLHNQLIVDGYFDEHFGFTCVDLGKVSGKLVDVEYEIYIKTRKKNLWPIDEYYIFWSEDDLFDLIEFLFNYISKPIDGTYHQFNNCGMHWETFNKLEGQKHYISKINELLKLYRKPFILSENGEILQKPEKGFEKIFKADIPSKDNNIISRINSAITNFRKHGSTIDDRRQSVRDLADVLEYLKPKFKTLITNQDESDLFNIANNFGIRHHNQKQKTNFDTSLWLSWMFYFYLSTIHVILRKIEKSDN